MAIAASPTPRWRLPAELLSVLREQLLSLKGVDLLFVLCGCRVDEKGVLGERRTAGLERGPRPSELLIPRRESRLCLGPTTLPLCARLLLLPRVVAVPAEFPAAA